MKNMTLNDYDASIVNLALRQYALSQLQEAIRLLQSDEIEKGHSATARGETASRIADALQK